LRPRVVERLRALALLLSPWSRVRLLRETGRFAAGEGQAMEGALSGQGFRTVMQ
jgi:hypothetical protein